MNGSFRPWFGALQTFGDRINSHPHLHCLVTEDRIIDHLKLTFTAENPPPPAWAFQDLMVADPPVEYFPCSFPSRRGEVRSVLGFIGAGVGRLTCRATYFPWPTPLDIARGPEYLRLYLLSLNGYLVDQPGTRL